MTLLLTLTLVYAAVSVPAVITALPEDIVSVR